ncbi:unnamed protein product [Mytilus coruscus]|uniref:TSPAN9 n=1 Tax=Mytilus coruscus TaxID=42192 RepID=A0A6J8CRS4_MYTCO|nr:unnamed protein product [Mytilus coruscus]
MEQYFILDSVNVEPIPALIETILRQLHNKTFVKWTLTFGFIFLSIYIKVKDDILDEEVIKVVDMEVIAGMPLGSTVKSIIFSLIGVFVVEIITGIFGLWGALGRKKRLLAVKTDLYHTLLNYTTAYQYTLYGYQHISYWNRVKTFPEFMQKICSIVAAEYIFRKLEFKEKKPSISENKYYLLLSLNHGIFRSLIIFIKENWNRSKIIFASVMLKISSLINNDMKFQLWLQQLGYFYGGSGNRITGHWNNMIMTLQCCGVNYYSETHTTYGIKFCCKNAHPRILDKEDPNTNSYYGLFDYFGGCGGYKTDVSFNDMCRSDLIIGILFANKEYSDIMTTKTTENSTGEEMYTKSVIFRTVFRSIKSFFLSNWKRSKITLVCFISLGIIFICSLVVLCLAINIRYDKVFGNLDIQDIFARINVTDHTFSRAINIFFIVTVTFSSLSIATVILSIVAMISPKWKSVLHFVAAGLLCSMLVANIVQTGLWGKFLTGVSLELENELRAQFESYDGGYFYSHHSATYVWSLSLSWNTLFVQAECCGVGSLIESSFTSTHWYSSGDRSSRRIPVQCCKSQTDVFSYADRYDYQCTNPMLDGYFHSQSCDDAVEKRLKTYSIIFFVFMAIIILAEMCCIIIIVYNGIRIKKDSKNLHLGVKAVDDTKEIRKEIEKHMLEPSMEDEAVKSRKRKKQKSKSGKISQINKSKSRTSIELQKKENTIIQEHPVNTTELQPIKSMEMEDNEKADGESKQVDTISGTKINDAEEEDTVAEYNTTVSDTQIKDATEMTDL